MILVVEAGATSTRWRAIDAQGQVRKARSEGVNVATIAQATVEDRIARAVAEEYGIRISGFQDDIIDSLATYHHDR